MTFDAEIIAAAFIPLLALLVISRTAIAEPESRAAIERWYVPLTALWFAPFWLTGGSPGGFDYLRERVLPWSAMAGGPPSHNPLLSDIPLQVLPWREVVSAALRNGSLPLLNRFAASGSPLWPNPQPAIFYPLTLLGLPFSTFAWPLFTSVAKILVALTGTYFFLRDEGVNDLAARFGAICFGFGAFQYAYLLFQHTNITVLLPWLLLAIRRRATAGAGVLVAVMIFGGHPETVVLSAFVAVPYAIWTVARSKRRIRDIAGLSIAAAGGVMVAAPVIVPFLRFLPLTERVARIAREPGLIREPRWTWMNLAPFVFPAELDHTRWTMPLEHFNDTATQYAGLAAFTLLVTAVIFCRRQNAFWLILLAVLTLLSFESAPVRAVVSAIPLVRFALLARLRFALGFITVIVATKVLSELDTVRGRRLTIVAAGMSAAVVMLVVVSMPMFEHFGNELRATASAALAVVSVAVLIAGAAWPPALRWLPLAAFADLASLGMTYQVPVARTLAYPRTPLIDFVTASPRPFRIVGLDETLVPMTSVFFGLEDIRIHDATSYEPYGRLLQSAGYDRRFYFARFHNIPPKVLLDFLGVRFLIAPPRSRASLPMAYSGADGVVFANRDALPRFFVPRSVRAGVFGSGADARDVFVGNGAAVAVAPAAVRLLRYGSSEAAVEVNARGDSFVASSEVAVPGWRLTCEGRPWPVTIINGLFVGWTARPGVSRFEMRYSPPGLATGVWLACAGVLLLAGTALLERGPLGPAPGK
jgi:hypothetical protein